MTLPPLRAVCFDFDQTLGCYDPPHFALYVLAAKEHGVQFTEAQLEAPLDDAWERWRTPLGIDHSHATTEAAFRDVRREVHRARFVGAGVEDGPVLEDILERQLDLEMEPEYFRLYPDTRPCLERLASLGLDVAIVSNHMWRLPEVVAALGLGGLVRAVLTSARIGVRKPHPAMFEALLRELGVPHEERDRVLFVGDSVAADVEGPRSFGMRAVLLDRMGHAPACIATRSATASTARSPASKSCASHDDAARASRSRPRARVRRLLRPLRGIPP